MSVFGYTLTPFYNFYLRGRYNVTDAYRVNTTELCIGAICISDWVAVNQTGGGANTTAQMQQSVAGNITDLETSLGLVNTNTSNILASLGLVNTNTSGLLTSVGLLNANDTAIIASLGLVNTNTSANLANISLMHDWVNNTINANLSDLNGRITSSGSNTTDQMRVATEGVVNSSSFKRNTTGIYQQENHDIVKIGNTSIGTANDYINITYWDFDFNLFVPGVIEPVPIITSRSNSFGAVTGSYNAMGLMASMILLTNRTDISLQFTDRNTYGVDGDATKDASIDYMYDADAMSFEDATSYTFDNIVYFEDNINVSARIGLHNSSKNTMGWIYNNGTHIIMD